MSKVQIQATCTNMNDDDDDVTSRRFRIKFERPAKSGGAERASLRPGGRLDCALECRPPIARCHTQHGPP